MCLSHPAHEPLIEFRSNIYYKRVRDHPQYVIIFQHVQLLVLRFCVCAGAKAERRNFHAAVGKFSNNSIKRK